METAALGRTGVEVSRLGFGGAPAGLRDYLQRYDPEDAGDSAAVIEAIGRAVGMGITYFDTAPGYGDGQGERLFGEGLSGADPASIFLATKCGVTDSDGIRRSLERSLTHLRRDWLDLVQIHGSTYTEHDLEVILKKGGMLEGMERLRSEGSVRWIGLTSEGQNGCLERLVATGRFDMMQIAYNFIFQHPYDPSRKTGALYDAEAAGMGIVTMRSATSGTLQRWIGMVNPGNTFDYTPALLQFQLSNPLIDTALVGMRSTAEVEQNVAIANDLSGRIDVAALHQRYVTGE